MTDAPPWPDADDVVPAEVLDEAWAMDEAITIERSPEQEAERVEAAAAAVEAENASAPSEAEVHALYAPPPAAEDDEGDEPETEE